MLLVHWHTSMGRADPRPVLLAVIGAAPAGAVQVTPVERVVAPRDALPGRTPSLFVITNQATALKPRVYPLGTDRPEAAIGMGERVDFHVGQLDAPLAQGPEGFDRSLEKIRAELLVCQNLADDQLDGSLRHDLPRRRPASSVSGARSQLRSRYDVGRATSLPPCDWRETRANRPVASVPAAFDSSEYTRARVSTRSGRWCEHHHPALAAAGPRGTETAPTRDIVERETRAAPDDSGAMICGRFNARLERRAGGGANGGRSRFVGVRQPGVVHLRRPAGSCLAQK